MLISAHAGKLPLADDSVQCVVTSPPYWGLRKYAGEQEIDWPKRRGIPAWRGAYGLEPTIEMYVAHTVEILREIRRVLRPDGVCFWNIGDSYFNCTYIREKAADATGNAPGYSASQGGGVSGGKRRSMAKNTAKLKMKDLCLIPARVAISAQSDGWWIRSLIVWIKPNPMPQSMTDRPTNAYEHILMLTKSQRYFWDADAVREPLTGNAHSRGDEDGNAEYQAERDSYHGFKSPSTIVPGGRNMRNVWAFPTQPYSGAHFATFPEEIPRRAILAATSARGACRQCGAPWRRITRRQVAFESGSGRAGNPPGGKNGADYEQARSGDYDIRMGPVIDAETIGWQPTCLCRGQRGTTRPCLVLDPFGGSGTTGKVATELGRNALLCDLGYARSSPEDQAKGRDYAALAERRTRNVQRPLPVA